MGNPDAHRPFVLRNGHLFDGRRHRPGHCLVVAGGTVATVVLEADLRDWLDSHGAALPGGPPEEVDLAGGLVLPGFQDAHAHPVQGGQERLRCDLSELTTREEYLEAVRTYAEANPGE